MIAGVGAMALHLPWSARANHAKILRHRTGYLTWSKTWLAKPNASQKGLRDFSLFNLPGGVPEYLDTVFEVQGEAEDFMGHSLFPQQTGLLVECMRLLAWTILAWKASTYPAELKHG